MSLVSTLADAWLDAELLDPNPEACASAFAFALADPDPDPWVKADALLELLADAEPPLECALDEASEMALDEPPPPPDAIAFDDEDAWASEPVAGNRQSFNYDQSGCDSFRHGRRCRLGLRVQVCESQHE